MNPGSVFGSAAQFKAHHTARAQAAIRAYLLSPAVPSEALRRQIVIQLRPHLTNRGRDWPDIDLGPELWALERATVAVARDARGPVYGALDQAAVAVPELRNLNPPAAAGRAPYWLDAAAWRPEGQYRPLPVLGDEFLNRPPLCPCVCVPYGDNPAIDSCLVSCFLDYIDVCHVFYLALH